MSLISPHKSHPKFGAVAKQKKIVSRLKRWLIGIIACVVASFLIFLTPEQQNTLLESQHPAENILESAINPIYSFLDEQDGYHIIRALRGHVIRRNQQDILLEEVTAETYHAKSDTPHATLTAQEGILNKKEKKLTLKKNVRAHTEHGYHMKTPQAMISLADKSASNNQEVTIRHPQLQIKAQGFELRQKERQLSFKGPVTILFHSSPQEMGRDKQMARPHPH